MKKEAVTSARRLTFASARQEIFSGGKHGGGEGAQTFQPGYMNVSAGAWMCQNGCMDVSANCPRQRNRQRLKV
ncbi:MAG: hypothetical protein AAB316_02860 [Bacteroidota bacterium]